MSDYHVVIRRDQADWQVWLDAGDEEEPDACSLLVGHGKSREAALQDALDSLTKAVYRVDRAIRRSVEVLS